MTSESLSPLANHLWQTSLFAGLVWLLTLVFRKHRAPVRYGLWLVASVKFLIPFSLLVGLGSQVGWRAAPQPQLSLAIEEISQPFSQPAAPPLLATVPLVASRVPAILFGIWFIGFAIGVSCWFHRWRRIHKAVRAASPLQLDIAIPVMSTSALLEPGVFGIRRPILLLPEGIAERLTQAQLEAIVAHELCHVRRRDNLAMTVHMVVEVLFWFHPLVWWIETRLVEERESACDEEVLRLAADPEVYAEGILNVCKFYLESPVVCVSGVTGANLMKRIETIMARRIADELTLGRKFLLAIVGIAAVVGPIVTGLMNAPQVLAQSVPGGGGAAAAFEVASIKASEPGSTPKGVGFLPGGGFRATNAPVSRLIQAAYHIEDFQLSGGPGWTESELYNIEAKPGSACTRDRTRAMLQTLLADRFKLKLRRETKELPVYTLVVAKSGPKLVELKREPTDQDGNFRWGGGRISGVGASMADFAEVLTKVTARPVLDRTGLKGIFDLKVDWTPQNYKPSDTGDELRPNGERAPNPDGPSLFTALQQQLGLKLDAGKGPVETLVIDHVEKPSDN